MFIKRFFLFFFLSFSPLIVKAESDFTSYPMALKSPASLFKNEYNEFQTLAKYRGQVVIFNFWASYCKPCIVELPSLNKLQRKFRAKGLVVLPIISSREDVSKIRSFYRRYKIRELGYFIDSNGLTARSFKVSDVPTSFILNKEGKLVASVIGAINWMQTDNVKYIESLLKEKIKNRS